MWLALAAPASFFSFESASHLALASDSHFFMWLVSAAPASFLSAESLLHVANALVVASESTAARIRVLIVVSSDLPVPSTGSSSRRPINPTMLCGQKAAASASGHRIHGRIVRENPVARQGRRRRILAVVLELLAGLQHHPGGARPALGLIAGKPAGGIVAVLRQMARQGKA